jgi:hypothetical protein
MGPKEGVGATTTIKNPPFRLSHTISRTLSLLLYICLGLAYMEGSILWGYFPDPFRAYPYNLAYNLAQKFLILSLNSCILSLLDL